MMNILINFMRPDYIFRRHSLKIKKYDHSFHCVFFVTVVLNR
uniref:Uncharacterized protein n=1 Tax=Arundo donax TaxID=35708 RepID=A0A0A9FPS9_ARUDO